MLVSLNECYNIKIRLRNLQSRMMACGNLELVHKSGLRVGMVSVLLIICCSARPWDYEQEEGRKGESGHGSSSMAYTSPAVKPQEPNPWMVNVDPYIPKWNKSTDVNFEPPAAAPAPDVFNVLLYNAAGDGVTDDTKVVHHTDRTLWLFIHFIIMTSLIDNSSQFTSEKSRSQMYQNVAVYCVMSIYLFSDSYLQSCCIWELGYWTELIHRYPDRAPISFWKCLISLCDACELRGQYIFSWCMIAFLFLL